MAEGYEIDLVGEFSAAHRLRLRDGAFEPLHGHNWRVEVTLQGDRLDDDGLLVDFTTVQPILRDITGALHNTCLNELPAFADRNPSTENLARHVHDRFAPRLPPAVRIVRVRVWETRGCAAAYVPAGPPAGRVEPDARRGV